MGQGIVTGDRTLPAGSAPVPLLCTAAQCRALDQAGAHALGIPTYELMLRAGRAALELLVQAWPNARCITICCGKGNNAGDGYVVAALARDRGLEVELLQVGSEAQLVGDAASARDAALAVAIVPVTEWPSAPRGDVVVDALLGTGLRGALAPPYAAAVDWINGSGRPILALDLPSGVEADTGAAASPAVQATVTLQFIGRKIGLYTGAGVDHAGVRRFDALGLDSRLLSAVEGVPLWRVASLPVWARLPPRAQSAYKQRFGHVLVIGGDHHMGGAPIMAAEAALRVGAGLVTVLTRSEHQPALLARRPEAMVIDADDGSARKEAFLRASCLIVGPGLGRQAWGRQLLREALDSGLPMVLDADGLNGLADTGWHASGPIIGTPHVGEAATLLGVQTAVVQRDRPAAAEALAARLGGVAVLKGAGSLVAALAEGGAARVLGVCAHGNPGMASAGMGDVLAGIIGGLLAQGLPAAAAALTGTCLHSAAADRASARLGERSLLATDLLVDLIALLAEDEQRAPGRPAQRSSLSDDGAWVGFGD
ncbi:MAG: NAD(P)H-hydrate dehydratase [Pseudomonadales bacterium]